MRKGRRQEVTGVVVNGAQPGVSRQMRRRLRAALHRATQAGTEQRPHWQGHAAQPSQLLGLAQFVHQVHPAQGRPLLQQARQLLRSPVERANEALLEASRQDRAAAQAFRQRAAAGQAPALASGKPWWQPAAPAAPVLEKTDQQRREERQQQRQAERAEARAAAAPQAADTPVRPQEPAPPPQGKSALLPGLLTYWAQIIICFVLGTVFQTRLITLIGIVLTVLLRWRRLQRWDVFAGAMVVAVLLGLMLRP